WKPETTLLKEIQVPRCAEEGKQNHILEQLAFSDPSRVTYGGIVYMKSVSADVEITTRLVISTSARQIYHLFARMCMKIFIRVLCVGFRSGSNVPAYQSDGIFCYEYEDIHCTTAEILSEDKASEQELPLVPRGKASKEEDDTELLKFQVMKH
ncbi:hypothetical protein T4A_5141, partial [Trichinella pseudospiralis]